MPRPRFEKLEPEKQQRLLETAATEFAAHGFDGASLNRVIDSAGLSKGAFYYYFDDKADLFATVIRLAWDAILPREPLALEALESDTFWPTLHGRYLEMMASVGSHPWLAGVAKLLYHPPPAAGMDTLIEQQFAESRAWLRRLLGLGQELGVVRTDLPEGLMLAMLWGAAEAADRWGVDHWHELEPAAVDRMGDGVFRALRRLVTPPLAADPEEMS